MQILISFVTRDLRAKGGICNELCMFYSGDVLMPRIRIGNQMQVRPTVSICESEEMAERHSTLKNTSFVLANLGESSLTSWLEEPPNRLAIPC